MRVLQDPKTVQAILLENKKDGDAMVEIIAAAIAGKKLNPRSNAYKMAMLIDNELFV